MTDQIDKACLITGAGRRIGAQIAKTLHSAGFKVILHCHHSQQEAQNLALSMNEKRCDSACVITANLNNITDITSLAEQSIKKWGRIDALINNASVFYPTELETINEEKWNDVINVNLKTPLFLTQQLSSSLSKHKGCIVNILDIHGEKPLKHHLLYCISKAGLSMLTKSLARELAPEIRCNGIAPGAVMWPTNDTPKQREYIIGRTALKRAGTALDVAKTTLFLIRDADYITGQTIVVDGGRTLSN